MSVSTSGWSYCEIFIEKKRTIINKNKKTEISLSANFCDPAPPPLFFSSLKVCIAER